MRESPINSKAAILQALVQGEGFGLELIERVKQRSGLDLRQGSIYPALRALERDGLVRSREGERLAERGGRPRVYYTLTAEGQRAAFENRELVGALFDLAPVRA